MMPQEMSSFLTAVSVILALFLFVPCIESVANLVRRRGQRSQREALNPQPRKAKSSAGLSGEIA